MWVLGFVYQVIYFGLMPLFLIFRGSAVRFSFFWGPFLASCVFFFGGLWLFGNKFLFIQKKKETRKKELTSVEEVEEYLRMEASKEKAARSKK